MLENYLVRYSEYQVGLHQYFPCSAEDFAHAEEQFKDAYPDITHVITGIYLEDTVLDNELVH